MPELMDLIAEQLDAAPAPPPGALIATDALVRDGRRAQSRRRIVLGAGAAAAVLVLGGAAWALAPGGDGVATDHPSIADQPTTSTSDPVLEGGLRAAYGPDGKLVIRDGWRVTQRIPNPMGFQEPDRSVGLEVTRGEDRYWYLLTSREGGSGAISDPAGKGFATLEEWVVDQAAANRPDPLMEALDLRPGGRIVSYDDAVTVVAQRSGVDLGQRFGPAEDTTVAEVRFEGRRWFVTALDHVRGGFEIGPAVDTPAAGTTLDSFIAYARDQYASGEGVR
ncbi:MAG TPA: hypothetical protein VNS55_12355 [Nocardioides sp.]|nr:hypothetical protein [Nocardioides sp.]